jgi:sugar transferase (PEP-CTERM/EpsH1 system associated)
VGADVKVLFLVTRFPLPPWRGDQLRAYHHLRVLAGRHTLTCVALVLRAPPPAARAAIEAMGIRLEVVPLGMAGAVPALARVLVGDRQPLQVLLHARHRARARVREVLAAGQFDLVHAQLVRAAPYLSTAGPPVVDDLIDALSTNFARRAGRERGLRQRLAAWEAGRLARLERRLVGGGTRCLVVSAREHAALGGAASVRVVPNGVDLDAFPYAENGRLPARLVFAGNLGYFPNVDAAVWLAREILPRVQAALPAAELRLVGARPARAVRALTRLPGVSLASAVPAMGPELAQASVAVVPLRAGSGLQNKLLEAMASGTPVVATPQATAGVEARPGEHLLVAEDASGLAAAAIALLREPERGRALARAARGLVERRYRWEDSAGGVEAVWREALTSA